MESFAYVYRTLNASCSKSTKGRKTQTFKQKRQEQGETRKHRQQSEAVSMEERKGTGIKTGKMKKRRKKRDWLAYICILGEIFEDYQSHEQRTEVLKKSLVPGKNR